MKRAHKTEGSDSLRLWRCIRPRGEHSNRRRINDLPDHLLVEILSRLGCPITTGRCKSVCKLWYSLISSPGFRIDPGFALIVNIPAPRQPYDEPHYASETSDLRRWSGFKLKYLPCFNGLAPVAVHASYKDLLLCTERITSQRKFFIVNPVTMHWIDLPETVFFSGRDRVPVGLAVKECPGEPLGYKFKVVRIILSDAVCNYFRAEVFDPNINHWIEILVNQPCRLCWVPTVDQCLVYKGVLHWLDNNRNGPVVAYDPFATPHTNGGYSCRFIMRSDEMMYNNDFDTIIKECITLCEEHILMVQLVTSLRLLKQGNETRYLTVWKLENYKEGKWVLEHRVYFKDMAFKFSRPQDKHIQAAGALKFPPPGKECVADCWFRRPKPLACHPNNSNIVYLYFPGNIVSCNLSTKLLKVVSRIDEQAKRYTPNLAVPFLISSQPTAVPRLR